MNHPTKAKCPRSSTSCSRRRKPSVNGIRTCKRTGEASIPAIKTNPAWFSSQFAVFESAWSCTVVPSQSYPLYVPAGEPAGLGSYEDRRLNPTQWSGITSKFGFTSFLLCIPMISRCPSTFILLRKGELHAKVVCVSCSGLILIEDHHERRCYYIGRTLENKFRSPACPATVRHRMWRAQSTCVSGDLEKSHLSLLPTAMRSAHYNAFLLFVSLTTICHDMYKSSQFDASSGLSTVESQHRQSPSMVSSFLFSSTRILTSTLSSAY